MIHEIKNADPTIFYIAYTDSEIFSFGSVDKNQVMKTGQPYLFQSEDRLIWKSKLINDFNTDPDDADTELI